MKKWISLIVFVFLFFSVKAHQPDISTTLLVETSDDQWILQVRASLTAFEYVVEENFGVDAYVSAEGFRNLVLDHLEKNISIDANKDIRVLLGSGNVQLGHESVVTFKLANFPQNMEQILIKNSSFSDIARNQSALVILKKGLEKKQVVLNKDNDHVVKMSLQGAKFELASEGLNSNSKYYGLSAVFAFLALGMLAFKVTGAKAS